jgi:quercetin dioxygenase-like cupin family protein
MEQLWFIANLAEVLVDRDDFSLVRMHAPAGDQPPLHVHEHEDEGFYVLEGSLTLWVGDADPVTLVPGEFALAPHGIPHTYRVGDSRGLFLVTSTPGTFPAFLRAAGAPAARPELPVLEGPPDGDRLATIAADHGITLLGPPGLLPTALVS